MKMPTMRWRDVYATIAMAKQLRGAQPRLFDYFFTCAISANSRYWIDIPSMKPLGACLRNVRGCPRQYQPGSPLAWHPDNRNAVIM